MVSVPPGPVPGLALAVKQVSQGRQERHQATCAIGACVQPVGKFIGSKPEVGRLQGSATNKKPDAGSEGVGPDISRFVVNLGNRTCQTTDGLSRWAVARANVDVWNVPFRKFIHVEEVPCLCVPRPSFPWYLCRLEEVHTRAPRRSHRLTKEANQHPKVETKPVLERARQTD